MAINMIGHIDSTFESMSASRVEKAGAYDVDGIWQESTSIASSHSVNIQPLNNRELQNLAIGGERINDVRKIYVNDGDIQNIKPSDLWQFNEGHGMQTYKTIALDARPWANYCKAIVSRDDDQ